MRIDFGTYFISFCLTLAGSSVALAEAPPSQSASEAAPIATDSGVIAAAVGATQAANPGADNLMVQAFAGGTAYLNGRYRYEYVDDEAVPQDGKASTLRTRLGLTTAERFALKGKVEFEDIHEIGNDLYNSTVNGREDRAVVADDQNTEVNEAHLTYTVRDNTDLTAGRYSLNLDNQRFIGDVDWRQNNQTFDGVLLTTTALESGKLLYAYLENVNRVFGDDSPVGDYDSNSHLFNGSYSGLSLGTIVLYTYLLDFEDAAQVSSATFGGRFSNTPNPGRDAQALYDFEYAYQTDYADSEKDYGANYYRGEVGGSLSGYKVLGAFESLGSDNATGFSTPLATLHRWNGWADKFLTTPDTGLNDAYATVGYTFAECSDCLVQKTALSLTYHYFSAETDSRKYGDEWDAQVLQPLGSNYSLGVKYASYSADSVAKDTDKLMGWFSYNFSRTNLPKSQS